MSISERINSGPSMHRVIVAAPEGQAHFAGAPLLLLPVADLCSADSAAGLSACLPSCDALKGKPQGFNGSSTIQNKRTIFHKRTAAATGLHR